MTSPTSTHKLSIAKPKRQNFVVISAGTASELEQKLNDISSIQRIGIISNNIDNGTFFATIALY